MHADKTTTHRLAAQLRKPGCRIHQVRKFLALGSASFAMGLALCGNAQAQCLTQFINPQYKYSHNTAEPSANVFTLEAGSPLPAFTYLARKDTEPHTLDDFLTRFCTTGFLVLKNDHILFERYLAGTKPSDARLSASLSKTILAMLIGIAINDGKLALTDTVAGVLPDFKDSAFADATVENLLRMASGVALVNSFVPGANSDNEATNPIASPRQDVRAYLRDKKVKSAPAGTQFAYNGVQTALLGLMLRDRVGMPLTQYLDEKIWQPAGMEAPAYWIKNFRGEEGVQGEFVATLRDYGRLGLLLMHRGKLNGKQLVPAEWIDQMTTLNKDKPQPKGGAFYGLHVWIPQAAHGRSFFWGTNGNNIFVDPIANVVIVHLGNSPAAEFNGNDHLFPLRDAILRALAGNG